MKKVKFQELVRSELMLRGARPSTIADWYELEIDTVAGMLQITPKDNWVACRFENVALAKKLVVHGVLNRYSGKWNFHFIDPTLDDVGFFLEQLDMILPVQERLAA